MCETSKNEKLLPDIQIKCGDNGIEILNAALDTEQTSDASGLMVIC